MLSQPPRLLRSHEVLQRLRRVFWPSCCSSAANQLAAVFQQASRPAGAGAPPGKGRASTHKKSANYRRKNESWSLPGGERNSGIQEVFESRCGQFAFDDVPVESMRHRNRHIKCNRGRTRLAALRAPSPSPPTVTFFCASGASPSVFWARRCGSASGTRNYRAAHCLACGFTSRSAAFSCAPDCGLPLTPPTLQADLAVAVSAAQRAAARVARCTTQPFPWSTLGCWPVLSHALPRQ